MNKSDLENRTKAFALGVIRFVSALPRTNLSDNIGRQLLRSGTFVGANYREANRAESRKDFLHKISIVQKEVSGLQMLRVTWQYRGFIWGMVRREFQVRYVNSLFGSLWAVLNPLAMIIIYTVVFSQVMRARLPGVDNTLAYSLYLCAGLLPWNYFTELVTRCQTVFVEQASLLKKISFPRITLPIILLISSTINFAIIFSLFSVFLVVSGRFPGWSFLGLLPLLVIQQGFALGFGILLGTINVFYRDVAQSVGVVLQFWFWFTPIVYSITLLPERAKRVYALNPMTGLVSGYQQIVLSGTWPQWSHFSFHCLAAVCVIALAFVAFYKLSGEMVDEL